MKQNNNKATKHKMLMRTAKPTNTVEALNAGLKMEEKFSKLPRHLISGSGMIPSEVGAELKKEMHFLVEMSLLFLQLGLTFTLLGKCRISTAQNGLDFWICLWHQPILH